MGFASGQLYRLDRMVRNYLLSLQGVALQEGPTPLRTFQTLWEK